MKIPAVVFDTEAALNFVVVVVVSVGALAYGPPPSDERANGMTADWCFIAVGTKPAERAKTRSAAFARQGRVGALACRGRRSKWRADAGCWRAGQRVASGAHR